MALDKKKLSELRDSRDVLAERIENDPIFKKRWYEILAAEARVTAANMSIAEPINCPNADNNSDGNCGQDYCETCNPKESD